MKKAIKKYPFGTEDPIPGQLWNDPSKFQAPPNPNAQPLYRVDDKGNIVSMPQNIIPTNTGIINYQRPGSDVPFNELPSDLQGEINADKKEDKNRNNWLSNPQNQLSTTGMGKDLPPVTPYDPNESYKAWQAPSQGGGFDIGGAMKSVEKAATIGITAINSFFDKKNSDARQRKDFRRAIMQKEFTPITNPYAEGTGSQAIFKNGGKMKGKKCADGGVLGDTNSLQRAPMEGTAEYEKYRKQRMKIYNTYPEASTTGNQLMYGKYNDQGVQGMNNPTELQQTLNNIEYFKNNNMNSNIYRLENSHYSVNANQDNIPIAKNGISLEGNNSQLSVNRGGKAENISSSDHSNPMIEFTGKAHSEGGIGINYGGEQAEVEHKEIGWVDDAGGLNIFGKLKVPGTNQTFKKTAKDLAVKESKVDRTKSKYLTILNQADEHIPYESTAISTAKVMFKSLDKQAKDIAEKKEGLASFQNLMLNMMEQDPEKKANGGRILAKGGTLTGDPTKEQKIEALKKYNFTDDDIVNNKNQGNHTLERLDDETLNKLYNLFTDPNVYDNAKQALMIRTASNGQVKFTVRNGGSLESSQKKYIDTVLRKHNLVDPPGNTKQSTDSVPAQSSVSTFKQRMTEMFPNIKFTREYAPGAKTKQGKDSMHGIEDGAIDIAPSSDKDGKIKAYLNSQEGKKLLAETKMGFLDETVGKNKKFGNAYHIGKDPALVKTTQSSIKTQSQPTAAMANLPTSKTGKDFKTVYVPLPQIDNTQDTEYGKATKDPAFFSDNTIIGNSDKKRGFLSPLAIEQIAPELLTIATNKRQAVPALSYQPQLKQTFDLSYQLGRNENQSSFNQIAQIAQQTGNTDALYNLAAQKYKADESYNVQEIQGNASQKLGVYGQNTDTLNDARFKNLAIIADQQNKQAQADFNTRKEDLAAFTSISAKTQQNALENRTYNAYANLFKHYGFDNKGNVTFEPDKVTRRFNEGEAQQFGMLAARDGINAVTGASKTATTYDGSGNVKKVTTIENDLEEFNSIMGSKTLDDTRKRRILSKRKNSIYLDGEY